MESIKQKLGPPAYAARPDFRNLGVILRLLLAVNLLAVLTVLVRVDDPGMLLPELVLMAGRVELPLFLSVLLLYSLALRLHALTAEWSFAGVCGVALVSVVLTWPLVQESEGGSLFRSLGWALGATLLCLLYFDYRSRLFSPALTEARLLALTARIRPHFLFNTLNGVLGVIRTDPLRAERGLEELADLFRVFMRDNRELVPLGDEIALCKRYLELEKLRLGERLRVRWEVSLGADDELARALVPALLLQPLVENAVYHGVEPRLDAGEVVVRVAQQGRDLLLEVDNEAVAQASHHAGNNMALDNIRERLMLFYDLEGRLESDCSKGRYCVRIRLPIRSSSA
ncbi:MAG: histidine kinase [Azoarcus sp.]|jgi:two-component system sensor histidine kinase AlgZ|nr:histidine kinase [Azoarcus sp.]MDD2873424.1 histidine kinase [Azoarcus sp.]